MNTLTNMNNFPIGNSLDGVNIITEEINTLSLLVDGTNAMLGDLNLDFNTIKNVATGVDGNDAVNKSQLDTKADTTYVNYQLGRIDGNIANILSNINRIDGNVANLFSNINRIDGNVNNIFSNINRIDGNVNNIFSNINRIDGNVINLFSNINRIDGNVTNLFSNINRIDGNVSNLFSNINRIDGNVSNLFSNINRIDGNVSNLFSNINRIDGNVSNLFSNINRIDGNVSNLFSNINRIDGNVSNLFSNINRIDGNVSNLFSNINRIDGNVSNLFSNISRIDNTYLLKAGGTMEGTLLFSGYNQFQLNSSADTGQGKHENYYNGDWYQVCRASTASKGLILRVSNNVAPTSTHDRLKITGDGTTSLLGPTTYIAGNVGIGTNPSASYKLYVQGSSYITSSLTAGGTVSASQGDFTQATVGLNLNISNGKIVINETTGTLASATAGTITLDHQNSGGGSSIVFKSKANTGSDYGYIEYRDNYNTANSENSALIIGVENDATNPANVDNIYLKTAGVERFAVNGNGIYAYAPIYKSVYNTGEHIKTTLYSNATHGTGALTITPTIPIGNSAFWPPSLNGFAFTRTFTDSTVMINIDATYVITGSNADSFHVEVYIGTSVTDSNPTLIYRTVQAFVGAGGGGGRSRTLLPLTCSYKTTNATLNLAVRVKIISYSGDDTIKICDSTVTPSFDYWTVAIQEYR